MTFLSLVLFAGCQSQQGTQQEPNAEQAALTTFDDPELAAHLSKRGTRTEVTQMLVSELVQYGLSKGYTKIDQNKIEKSLSNISINCENDSCQTKWGEK